MDSGVVVAVMRNRFTAGDLAAVTRIDRIVAETLPCNPPTVAPPVFQ